MYKIMTPGPTQVKENVRMARSFPCTNPDLDPAFYDYYKETCELISELLETKNTSYILDGEGILGLEAACASLTEPGDQVLVLDNGVYGKGFADLVFIPKKQFAEKPALVVELKWDKSAESAIKQMKEKKYFESLEEYQNNMLLVGINYDKKTKEHVCKIEEYLKK